MRIVVKNIPAEVTESEVREHFAAVAVPTDVRILTDAAGRSRRVAFVGYKTEEAGRKSIVHYNKSYYKNARMQVEEIEKKDASEENTEERNRKRKAYTAHTTDISVNDMKEIVRMITKKKETWENTPEPDSVQENERDSKRQKETVEEIIAAYKEKQENSNRERIKETGEVYVRGIPYTATEAEIETEFAKYGPVSEVYVKHKEREDAWGEGESMNCGYAIVTYTFPQDAYKLLDSEITFQGRNVTVTPSRGKPKEEETGKNRTNMSYGKYSALFFNFTAVLGIAAKEKRISKAQILKHTGSGIGGRIALLESELVEKTKAFLTREGICTECTCKKQACTCMFVSKKAMLIKNIPYGTTESEIRKFFKKYTRLIFAPAKTLAILEYSNKSDAAEEHRKNNCAQIRDHPIYIEYLKVTKERYTQEAQNKYMPKIDDAESSAEQAGTTKQTNKEAAQYKVILKNVPFQVGRSELSELIEGVIGKEYKLRMPQKFDGTHRGFCFVEVDKADLAKTLVERCTHLHLYGRHIIIEPANL